MIFFLRTIWVFILTLGLFYILSTYGDSFHRYTPFWRIWWSRKGPNVVSPVRAFAFQLLSPLMRGASCMSFGIIVTLFAWMAHKLESSRRLTKYASEASCRAIMAPLWKRMFILPKSWAISLTSR